MIRPEFLAELAEVAKTEPGRQAIFRVLNPLPQKPRAFYFGCNRESGHYFWNEHGSQPFSAFRSQGYPLPWREDVDGGLCPGTPPPGRHGAQAPQVQGLARLHHKDGWTALAFCDRSVDKRHGSNSAFFVEGLHDFEAVVAITRERFPWVWSRFSFEVRLAPEHYGQGT